MNIEQQLTELGKCIKHLHFNDYPNDSLALSMLIDGNDEITFAFPYKKIRPMSVNCYPSDINSRITTAHIETDCFIDYIDFYSFTSLEILYLSISMTDIDYYDDRQVAGLWHVLRDLASGHLKKIEFDISALPDTAQEQIQTFFSNPHKVVDLEFIERRKKLKK